MTEEEKKELEELSAKEVLTEEEQARKAELEAKPLAPQDEFDEAFDEAISDADPAKKDDVLDEEINAEAKKLAAEKQKEEEEKAKEAELAQQDDTTLFNNIPEDSQANAGEEQETPEQYIARIEAELVAEKQRTSSWEGRIKAANKRADEAEAGAGQNIADKGKKALPNTDDDLILEEFVEEFPSLEKPMKLLATKIAREMVDEQMQKINPALTQVQETVESNAVNEHLGKITQAHSDWRQIHKSGALSTWISKQPNFMQAGLNQVVQEGSAEDIIELFTTYKKSIGQLKTVIDSGSDKTAAQKLKELEAVRHQSSGPPKDTKKADKNDFDAAWEDALTK